MFVHIAVTAVIRPFFGGLGKVGNEAFAIECLMYMLKCMAILVLTGPETLPESILAHALNWLFSA